MTDSGPRLCKNCLHCATINSSAMKSFTYHECDHPSSVVHPTINLVTGASLKNTTRLGCEAARTSAHASKCGAVARFFEARVEPPASEDDAMGDALERAFAEDLERDGL